MSEPLGAKFEAALSKAADALTAAWPQRRPTVEALRSTRIISHRGERGSHGGPENTFAAFDPLVPSGVWGLETDIRFSADGVPMIIHDADARRVFGSPVAVANHTAAQLRGLLPQVPTLAQFVARYHPRFHLMLELKDAPDASEPTRVDAVQTVLAHLKPGRHYHLMSLTPPLLDHYDVPEHAKISIGRFSLQQVSDHVIERGQAALGAHYALLRNAIARRHLEAGQELAIGFPASRNCLRAQIHRGAKWLYCDEALQVQRWLELDLAASVAE